MSVPRLGRASLPPGRSSVPQCRVHHFTVITVLLVATMVASSQPKDECQQDSANFASQIHTIGSIYDALWAITKPDWNVYKLTPCDPSADDSLVHCIKVDSPIAVDNKWPKLAESAKSEAKATDFTFPVDNSVIMDSSIFGQSVLAMHGHSFPNKSLFGFDFGMKNSVYSFSQGEEICTGLWISSDEKDKAYRLSNSTTKMETILFWNPGDGTLLIKPNGTQKNICSTGSKEDLQVRFQDGDCSPTTDWSVKKGVLYHKQFYFFGSTKVYIFSEQAELDYTKLQTVSLTDFFYCHGQTTMVPPPISPNATFPQISTNSTHMSTTAKGFTTIIIIVVVVIGLAVIVALGLAYFCWCRTKASKNGKSGGNIKLASSSSPNDSKVSAKARNVSKGSIKGSQTKVRPVRPKAPLCKQAV